MTSDAHRLERIVQIGTQLQSVIDKRSISRDDLQNDLEAQWLISTPLYNIGEHVNRLSDETIHAFPDVPWSQIAGTRHRLVHDYEGIDWGIIASAVFDELPSFVDQVSEIITTITDKPKAEAKS